MDLIPNIKPLTLFVAICAMYLQIFTDLHCIATTLLWFVIIIQAFVIQLYYNKKKLQ